MYSKLLFTEYVPQTDLYMVIPVLSSGKLSKEHTFVFDEEDAQLNFIRAYMFDQRSAVAQYYIELSKQDYLWSDGEISWQEKFLRRLEVQNEWENLLA